MLSQSITLVYLVDRGEIPDVGSATTTDREPAPTEAEREQATGTGDD